MKSTARTRHHPRTVHLAVLSATVPVLAFSAASHAWLGGFESADGYQPFLNFVQNYNAGQYGPNGGYGGGPSAIAPNSGLWQAVSGGFFSPGAVSYATGHQNYDRQWVNNGIGSAANQGLVVTTGHEGWGGPPCKYKYDFDAPDFGGTNPSATGGARIKLSFWTRGNLAGPELGGQVPTGYFGNEIAFQDSSGNVGMRFGLTQRPTGDTVTFWNGSTLFESTVLGGFSFFDRWDVDIDLAAGTFSADYFQFTSSTTFNFVTNQPLQSAMSNLSAMTLRSSDGVSNNKLWAVDDFTFNVVPAPGALAFLAPAAMILSRRRR